MRDFTPATVVVIDDDASIRRALDYQLRMLGFRVLIYSGAEEFLAAGLPGGDVCLLLDVFLPTMYGIDVGRRLAASGQHPPTVLMSARDDPATRTLMRQAHPIACLFKPFDEAKLLRALRKGLPKIAMPRS